MPTPTLVVVSGPPGSGKTRLAHAIAQALPCPAVSRDEIKEGMAHAHPGSIPSASADALALPTNAAFFEVLRNLVAAGVSVVAEAAFQDRVWRPRLEPFLEIARLRVVRCTVAESIARERLARRLETEPSRAAHADRDLLGAIDAGRASLGSFERLSIAAPTIDVDTTDGYAPSLDEIVRFINTPDVRD